MIFVPRVEMSFFVRYVLMETYICLVCIESVIASEVVFCHTKVSYYIDLKEVSYCD